MYALMRRASALAGSLALVAAAVLVAALVGVVPGAARAQTSDLNPQVGVSYWYEFGYGVSVNLSDFTPSSAVELRIYDVPGGALLADRTVTTDADGYWQTCCSSDQLGLGFEMTPGMELVAVDTTTGISTEMTLAHFTIDRSDPLTNTVSGTAPAGSGVWVGATNTEWTDYEVQAETTAKDDGSWSVNLDDFGVGFHLGWGAQVEAWTWDSEGDSTGAMSRPAWISVAPASDSVMPNTISGWYWGLNSAVTVEVRSGAGALLLSDTVPTDNGRNFTFDTAAHGLELAPGMRVTVSDPAVATKQVTLEPLSLDVVDPATSRVAGTAMPGTPVSVYLKCPCWDGGGLVGVATTGADGQWSFVNPNPFDATIESGAFVYDQDNDYTHVGHLGPLLPTELATGTTVCDGTYSGTGKDVSVPAGASCTLLPGTTIAHDLTVQRGGELTALGVTIGHDLTLDAGQSSICATGVKHDLTVRDGTAPILVGDTAGGCWAGNTVGHDLVVQSNTGGVDVGSNTVAHDLKVLDNTGGATVNTNTAGHDALCRDNHPQAGSGNKAGHSNTCPS